MIISEEDLICLVNEMGEALFKASKELLKHHPNGDNEAIHSITNILLSNMYKQFLYTYGDKEAPTRVISVRWQTDDVKIQAKESYDTELSDEQCGEILDFIKHYHDCTIGITWETINFAIEEFIEKTARNEQKERR
ncbi:MAG: hypothetical protein GY730_06735 [bacterium]|nr:hypothetical protein [bacterium]